MNNNLFNKMKTLWSKIYDGDNDNTYTYIYNYVNHMCTFIWFSVLQLVWFINLKRWIFFSERISEKNIIIIL